MVRQIYQKTQGVSYCIFIFWIYLPDIRHLNYDANHQKKIPAGHYPGRDKSNVYEKS